MALLVRKELIFWRNSDRRLFEHGSLRTICRFCLLLVVVIILFFFLIIIVIIISHFQRLFREGIPGIVHCCRRRVFGSTVVIVAGVFPLDDAGKA